MDVCAAIADRGGVEVRVAGFDRLVRRVAHQPREHEQQQRHGRSDRGRRKREASPLQLELPPELVRVLDVLEGEEAEPDRRAQRTGDGDDPGRRESRVEQRGSTIERRPRSPEDEEDRDEEGRLLVVRTLEQRRRDPDDHGDDGEDVGGVEPPREPLREHEQRRADDAAEEMRGLDHAERQDADRAAAAGRPRPASRRRTAARRPRGT